MSECTITENEDFMSNLLAFNDAGIIVTHNKEENSIRFDITDEAADVVSKVEKIYKDVAEFNSVNDNKVTVMVDLKHCKVDTKAEVIRFALGYNDLEDPLMLLNILNLVKMYNTLDDNHFAADDVFVNSIEELLDLKLLLSSDIKEFSRKLSIYFLSIIKSYNKMTFTPADDHTVLPKVFEALILASDLLTLSGIFAKATNISTEDLVYVDNAYIYMTSLINKGITTSSLLGEFLEKQGA